MDDAKGLVSELQHKLGELNDKVAAYQRDMVAEFEKHMQDRLKSYPDHVAAQVSAAIAESMPNYPALFNYQGSSPPTPTLADRRTWDGRRSPPPILYHTSGIPKDGPRSPHEREEEFHGLFTPSYLPLLEANEPAMQSPPTSTTPASPSLPLPLPPPLPSPLPQEAVDHAVAAKPSASDTLQPARPTPIRRLTDMSSSSVESSGSEARTRRSALRRTSSSAKGSPRRVRFEFQGMEVLPNSSPQASTVLGQARAAEAQPDTSAIIEEDESPAYTGTSLLDMDGDEEELPRPKKVSSTQALRALSQQPLDAGTVWTVVNAEAEGAFRMNVQEELAMQPDTKLSAPPNRANTPQSRLPPGPATGRLGRLQVVEQPGSPIEEMVPNEDEDASDEEVFLSIGLRNPNKSQSPSAQSPLPNSPTQSASASQDIDSSTQPVARKENVTAPRAPALPLLSSKEATGIEEDEALFEFEEEGSRPQQGDQPTPRKYIKEEESEPSSPNATKNDAAPVTSSAKVGSLPVRRPAAAIAMLAQSVGSYKGASLNFAPISNPELYEEIASMRDVQPLVGSVHDRRSPDASDLSDYRATIARLSGVPKSFSERLAFEELMERRKAEEAAGAAAER